MKSRTMVLMYMYMLCSILCTIIQYDLLIVYASNTTHTDHNNLSTTTSDGEILNDRHIHKSSIKSWLCHQLCSSSVVTHHTLSSSPSMSSASSNTLPYSMSDTHSKTEAAEVLLSQTSLIPLDLTYLLYDPTSTFSLILALLTFLPLVIVVMLTTLTFFNRNIEATVQLFTAVCSTVLNSVMKQIIKEARPAGSVKKGYGMPSDHSQFMALFTVYWLCWIWHSQRVRWVYTDTDIHTQPQQQHQYIDKLTSNTTTATNTMMRHDNMETNGVTPSRREDGKHMSHSIEITAGGIPFLSELFLKYFFSLSLLLVTSLVMYSRIHFQVHTVPQVLVGALCGILMGLLWYILSYTLLYPSVYPLIVHSIVGRIFYIRDTGYVRNLVRHEWYTHAIQHRCEWEAAEEIDGMTNIRIKNDEKKKK